MFLDLVILSFIDWSVKYANITIGLIDFSASKFLVQDRQHPLPPWLAVLSWEGG